MYDFFAAGAWPRQRAAVRMAANKVAMAPWRVFMTASLYTPPRPRSSTPFVLLRRLYAVKITPRAGREKYFHWKRIGWVGNGLSAACRMVPSSVDKSLSHQES